MAQAKSKKKILIVEDEPYLLDVLYDEFTSAGFLVIKATDGEQGFSEAQKSHPDIVLIDILMPKMDGITMFKKMHENQELKNIPGIILTNMNDTKTISAALESGAYDFLVKSDWEPKALVARVNQKLGGGA